MAGEVELFQEMAKTVSMLGVPRTITLLQESRNSSVPTLSDPHVSFVVKQVCKALSIPVSELLKKTYTVSDGRKYGIGFCILYLRDEFDLNYGKLGKMFDLSRSFMWKREALIKNLSKTSKADREMYAVKERLDFLITEYKLSKTH